MQGKTVQYVSTTKFLGVLIDNKIKWNDHIIYIKNEISKSIGVVSDKTEHGLIFNVQLCI